MSDLRRCRLGRARVSMASGAPVSISGQPRTSSLGNLLIIDDNKRKTHGLWVARSSKLAPAERESSMLFCYQFLGCFLFFYLKEKKISPTYYNTSTLRKAQKPRDDQSGIRCRPCPEEKEKQSLTTCPLQTITAGQSVLPLQVNMNAPSVVHLLFSTHMARKARRNGPRTTTPLLPVNIRLALARNISKGPPTKESCATSLFKANRGRRNFASQKQVSEFSVSDN